MCKSLVILLCPFLLLISTRAYCSEDSTTKTAQYRADTVVLRGIFIEQKSNALDKRQRYGDDSNGSNYVFVLTPNNKKFSKKEIEYNFNRECDSLFFCCDQQTIRDFNSFLLNYTLSPQLDCDCPIYSDGVTKFKTIGHRSKYRYRFWFLNSKWLRVRISSQDAKYFVEDRYINKYKELTLFLYLKTLPLQD